MIVKYSQLAALVFFMLTPYAWGESDYPTIGDRVVIGNDRASYQIEKILKSTPNSVLMTATKDGESSPTVLLKFSTVAALAPYEILQSRMENHGELPNGVLRIHSSTVFQNSPQSQMLGLVVMEAASADLSTYYTSTILGSERSSEERERHHFELMESTLLAGFSFLAFLQEVGLYHNDIKPQNTVVFENGRIAFIDYDSMSSDSRDNALQNSSHLTFQYSAPERLQNPGFSSVLSDAFSLGATAFYLLTGTSPVDLMVDRVFPPEIIRESRYEELLAQVFSSSHQKTSFDAQIGRSVDTYLNQFPSISEARRSFLGSAMKALLKAELQTREKALLDLSSTASMDQVFSNLKSGRPEPHRPGACSAYLSSER